MRLPATCYAAGNSPCAWPSAQAQTPHLAVEELCAAIEAACNSVSTGSAPAVVTALQQPLRTALTALDTANFEADQSLRGAGVNATGDMPTGWARELWTHAFAATVWSGDLTLLMDAHETYRGAPIDYQRFEVRAAAVELRCARCRC